MLFLDFEASGMMGYPIEVGFALVEADRTIRSASKLIHEPEWLDDFSQWDPVAAALHGITREQIAAEGEPPAAVVDWLEREIGGLVACVDSPFDKAWMSALVAEARGRGGAVNFGLIDLAAAMVGPEVDGSESSCAHIEIRPKTHRAAADAEHLASLYLQRQRPGATVNRLHLIEAGYERRAL